VIVAPSSARSCSPETAALAFTLSSPSFSVTSENSRPMYASTDFVRGSSVYFSTPVNRCSPAGLAATGVGVATSEPGVAATGVAATGAGAAPELGGRAGPSHPASTTKATTNHDLRAHESAFITRVITSEMSTVQRFETELQALLVATGHPPPPPGAATWQVTSGNLEITIHNNAGRIEVLLMGWRHSFTLADDRHDTDANTEAEADADDEAALALDLIGAALLGGLRVTVDRYNGVPRRFTLQTRSDTAWHPASTQGSRPWNPLARRSGEVHTGRAAERPPRYRPRRVTPLPWAPWAGLAGFYGAPAAALPTELPVDGTLDLHNFSPREIKPLVLAYVDACLARGITELRIVHGKGIGNLRRTVHALLDRHPRVKGYRLGGHGGGSWGATLVDLSPGPAADPGP